MVRYSLRDKGLDILKLGGFAAPGRVQKEALLANGGSGAVYLIRLEDNRGNIKEHYVEKRVVESAGGSENFIQWMDHEDSSDETASMIPLEAHIHAKLARKFPTFFVGYKSHHSDSPASYSLRMEYMSYGTLTSMMRKQKKQRISEGFLRHLLSTLAGACVAMRDCGVLHNDIKPDNILLGKAAFATPGNFPSIKLTDFDGARYITSPQPLEGRCTVGYIPPEIILFEKHPKSRLLTEAGADAMNVYQCAKTVLAAMDLDIFPDQKYLRRDHVHGGVDMSVNTRTLKSTYTAWLLDIVRECLVADPTRRPSSADVVARMNPYDPIRLNPYDDLNSNIAQMSTWEPTLDSEMEGEFERVEANAPAKKSGDESKATKIYDRDEESYDEVPSNRGRAKRQRKPDRYLSDDEEEYNPVGNRQKRKPAGERAANNAIKKAARK